MNVTREVITDLLSVYFSGEASNDTRALVEDFFRSDPEFAALARTDWSPANGIEKLKEEVPLEILNRTKRYLRNRSIFLAVAILFSLLPFSVLSHGGKLYWAWREMPEASVAAVLIGIAGWCAYTWSWYRVRSTGL